MVRTQIMLVSYFTACHHPKVLMIIQRDVVIRNHPTMFFVILICLNLSWILGIQKLIRFDKSQITYGQIFSLFATVPVLYSFAKLLAIYRRRMRSIAWEYITSVYNDLRFLITGRDKSGDSNNVARSPSAAKCWTIGKHQLYTRINFS